MAASPLAAALLGGGGSANPLAMMASDPAMMLPMQNLQLGQGMLQAGLSTAPAYPMQALARVLQGATGGYMERGALSQLGQAYAYSAKHAAATLPDGNPLKAALMSDDPVVWMQGLQAYQKGLILMSQPSNVGPGQSRVVGSQPVYTSNQPLSPEGKTQADINRFSGQPPVPAQNAAPGASAPSGAAPPAPSAGAPSASAGVPLTAPSIGNAGSAISGIESGGNYSAVGPVTRSGDRAYGKYGVMGANIGPWTQQVLGQAMTPQQFLANPQAQDAVFKAKFGQYAQAYGPEGAARAWFAGPGNMNNPTAHDQLGTTVAGYAQRFDQATGAPQKAPATSLPTNPLQGAVNLEGQEAAAKAKAEANVEYGNLLKPQGPIPQGPGGTEPVTMTHGSNLPQGLPQKTTIPPLSEQGALPNSPAEAKTALPVWQKTETGLVSGLAMGQDAEQRLSTIAQAFKIIKTGWGAEQEAQVNAALKSIGLPELLPNANPAAAEMALHENYVQTLQRLKSAMQGTGGRFTQMEFRLLSENAEHPDLQPEANLTMLSQDLAQIRQNTALAQDWITAKSKYGWQNPQAFTEAWLRHNPIAGFTATAQREIGPLKGMVGNETGTQPAFPGASPATPRAPQINTPAAYAALPSGAMYIAPDGTIRHKR